MRIKTAVVRAGVCTDTATGAISTPIHQTATFRHEGIGISTGYDYSRTSNPTRKVLEEVIRDLEGGHQGFAFSTGMAAVTAALMLFSPGDHLVISDDLYGGTYRLMEMVFRQYGIETTYVDTSAIGNIEEAIMKNTRGLLVETPSNPLMKITDLRQVAVIAKKHQLISIVDNTFMTPYFQQPLQHGIDVVIHSGTKFLGGHNDVLCGLIVTRTEALSTRVGFIQNATGAVLAPMDSWLMIRGIKTLAVRLEQQQKNAMRIAQWLKEHPAIQEVYYPGLMGHPGHEIQKEIASGFGGVVSFRTAGRCEAQGIINHLQFIPFAESLGGVETLITYPAMQTHGDIPKEIRDQKGVTEDLLRLSVGIEAIEDIQEDLDRAISICLSSLPAL